MPPPFVPLLRNRRLARRGFSSEPAYQRQGRGIVSLLFKLVPAVAVLAILAAIAIPAYQDYANRAGTAAGDQQRVADLAQIQGALDAYHLDHNVYPLSETETLSASAFAAALNDLVTGGYLAALPTTPAETRQPTSISRPRTAPIIASAPTGGHAAALDLRHDQARQRSRHQLHGRSLAGENGKRWEW